MVKNKEEKMKDWMNKIAVPWNNDFVLLIATASIFLLLLAISMALK